MLPSQWPLKRRVTREIFATNDRVTLRFIDAGRSFLPNAWRWRVTMSTLMSIR
ncbi:hypothetical protein LNP05_15370 [Klebsiella pneumoniae subsp. pneumoniae]|nr:hypothetical protein [Klebsiella pneumoniae subsp. pneumoniae]